MADPRRPRSDLSHRLHSPRNKRSLLQKIRWRIPANSQLRKDNKLRALFVGACRIFKYLFGVSGEIPNRRIDLRESYLHRLKSNA